MPKHGKRYRTNLESVDREKLYEPSEAVSVIKGFKAAKFDETVGRVTRDQLREIATLKMADLNANDIDAAARQIEGTARSMGIEVVG